MLGNRQLPKSVPGAASEGRAAILALALAASGFFVAIGSAQAQDCEGGYRMVKGEVPVACEGGFDQAVAPTAPIREPLHTGSISRLGAGGGNADDIPAAVPSSTHMNGMKCVGGYAYRPTANESYITMPMACN